MTIEIRKFHANLQHDWACVIERSRNGTFLCERDYLEYHVDRFIDASFIIYEGKCPVALLPASLDQNRALVSHAGLTFAGLIVDRQLRAEQVDQIVGLLIAELKSLGFATLELREPPLIFCAAASEDVRWAFSKRGFGVTREDLATVIDLQDPLEPSKSKRRDLTRAARLGIKIDRCSIDQIYPVISEVLHARHSASPVHSLEELARLASAFPDRIFALGAKLDDTIVAGTVIYAYDRVWHTQYLASNSQGRATSALDAVIFNAIERATQAKARWFSMGHSMAGDVLNGGLLWQKESFGGRGLIFPRLRGVL